MAEILKSLKDRVQFTPDRFNPVVLAGSAQTKAIMVCLEEGQFIPGHSPDSDLCLYVIEGEGEVYAAGVQEPVEAGALVFVPAGEARGIRAVTRMVVLHIVSPPPGEAAHAEMFDKLQKGIWP